MARQVHVATANSCSCLIALLLVVASIHAFAPARRPSSLGLYHAIKVEHGHPLRPSFATSTISEEEEVEAKVLKKLEEEVEAHLLQQIRDKEQQQTDSTREHKHCLELDPVGRLRLCHTPDILLQGLDPHVWSASRSPSGKSNSLFLHTAHPESLSEHQTSLGSLISCRRLLACARKLIVTWFAWLAQHDCS
jgi:hypothetical protein